MTTTHRIDSAPFQGGSKAAYRKAVTEIRTNAAEYLGIDGQVRIKPGAVQLFFMMKNGEWGRYSADPQLYQVDDVALHQADQTFKVAISVPKAA